MRKTDVMDGDTVGVEPSEGETVYPFDLSVVVPLYNEEENVALMHKAIVDAVRPLGLRAEIVFVDDGSRDATFARASLLPKSNPTLRLIKLRRNAGQTAAMVCGIDHARGRVIVTMDGDLQNDPGDIPLFLEKIDEGYDLVVGWRHKRQDHWSRVLPSKIANRLIALVTGVPIRDNGCSLKAYRADLIKKIPLYNEMHRFIPAMASMATPRLAQIKVRHHPRRFGTSKYGFSRIYKVVLDLLTIRTLLSFGRRPALWLGMLGCLTALVALAAMLTGLGLLDDVPPPSPMVFFAVAVLYGSLAIFSLFMALLIQLLHAAMKRRISPYVEMSARRVGTTSPLAPSAS